MIWIAPSAKHTDSAALEERLWAAADTAGRVSANPARASTWRDSRGAKDHWSANSGLKSQEYSAPVLGLIFLRCAEVRFAAQRARLKKASPSARRGSRVDQPAACHAERILHLWSAARTRLRQIQNCRRTRDLLLPRPRSAQAKLKSN